MSLATRLAIGAFVVCACECGGGVWGAWPESRPAAPESLGRIEIPPAATTTQPAAGAPLAGPGPMSSLPGTAQRLAKLLGGGGVGASCPFAPLMPSLDSVGAPYWLKEGVRLTFYQAAAFMPLTDHYYYKDEEGGWVDKNGNRYRREENIGGGGDGISQVNIACVDGQRVVAHVRTYHYLNHPGPLLPLMTQGWLVSPGVAEEWWVNPKSLREAVVGMHGGVRVLRGPYNLNGKTWSAVRFEIKSDQSQAVYTYDEVTGLMLHTHRILYEADKQILMSSNLMEWRTVKYPWANVGVPAWVQTVNQLQYAGTRVLTSPGAAPYTMPLAVTATFTRKEPRWVSYRVRSMLQIANSLPQTPSENDLVTGPSQFGGIWMNPQSLRTLRLGQVLDQDRTANTTVTVSRADAAGVQITETGQAHTLTFTYDGNTGVMASSTMTDSTIHAQTEISLRR
jgi:hypothetical protein